MDCCSYRCHSGNKKSKKKTIIYSGEKIMKKCKYCSCELSQDSKFCTMCGSPVEDYYYEETTLLSSNDDDWGEMVVLS